MGTEAPFFVNADIQCAYGCRPPGFQLRAVASWPRTIYNRGVRPGGTYTAIAIAVAVAATLTVVASRGGDHEGELETSQDVPLSSPAAQPAIAAQDNSALVVRGTPDSSGELYDLDGGRLVSDSKLPFADPIGFPDVAATDNGDYMVAGVSCAEVIENGSLAVCEPGGVAVARFDASDRIFETITATGLEGETPYVNILGETESSIILQLGGEIYALPSRGGRLSPFSLPPLESFTVACGHGDQIVAVEIKLGPGEQIPEPGEVVETPSQLFVPFEAAVLDLKTGRWTSVGGPEASYDIGDTFEVGCIDRGVLAVPDKKPESGESPYVSHLLDLTQGRWVHMPPPPREFLSAAPPAYDGNRFTISVSSDLQDADTAVLVFNSGTGTWAEEAGGDGADADAVAVTGDRFLSLSDASARPREIPLQP